MPDDPKYRAIRDATYEALEATKRSAQAAGDLEKLHAVEVVQLALHDKHKWTSLRNLMARSEPYSLTYQLARETLESVGRL